MKQTAQTLIWSLAVIGVFFLSGGTFEYTNSKGDRIIVGHYNITANK